MMTSYSKGPTSGIPVSLQHYDIIIDKVDSGLVSQIQLAYVFNGGQSALFVTKDDKVYGASSSSVSHLGFTTGTSTQIDILSDKGVQSIVYGHDHMICLTQSGAIYAWGGNGQGQLGFGSSNFTTPQLCTTLSNVRIYKVCAAEYFSMALDDKGQVYCWGYNASGQCGLGHTNNVHTPTQIATLMEKTVMDIACGNYHSVAMTDVGIVYTWGNNDYGQLGRSSRQGNYFPLEIDGNLVCKQIACGIYHTLLLSRSGEVFVTGHNNYGQLGLGNTTNVSTPTKIPKHRFVEIAAHFKLDFSAALSEKGELYQCGNFGQKKCLIKLGSINDVFATFGLTYNTLVVGDGSRALDGYKSIKKDVSLAFNNDDLSDVKFKIEGKILHASKGLLLLRSEYFKAMFESKMKESTCEEIEIVNYTYPVYKAFLQYLYTENIGEITFDDLIELYDLANCTREKQLENICSRVLNERMTVDTAMVIFSLAMKYQNEELLNSSLVFSIRNLELVVDSVAFQEADATVLREFVKRSAAIKR